MQNYKNFARKQKNVEKMFGKKEKCILFFVILQTGKDDVLWQQNRKPTLTRAL